MLLLLMAGIWGVNFSSVKYASQAMTPLSFTVLRVGGAAAILLVLAVLEGREWPSARDAAGLIALGLVGNGLYQLLFVSGLSLTRVANAALIVAAAPAFIAVVSWMRGVERAHGRMIAGIALSVAGVALVILGSARTSTGGSSLLGTALVFSGVLCWTFFSVGLEPYTHRVSPIKLSALTMLGGVLPLLLVAPRALAATNWGRVTGMVWLAFAYSTVVAMVIAYLFWYRGIRVLGPTRASVYGNLQPIVAILVAWVFLRETPTVWQGVGTGTIITGLLLTRT